MVLYLMTQLPPLPKIELDDEKEKREKKKQIYGSALVPSIEALCQFKEQLAGSKDVLTVGARNPKHMLLLCKASACAVTQKTIRNIRAKIEMSKWYDSLQEGSGI